MHAQVIHQPWIPARCMAPSWLGLRCHWATYCCSNVPCALSCLIHSTNRNNSQFLAARRQQLGPCDSIHLIGPAAGLRCKKRGCHCSTSDFAPKGVKRSRRHWCQGQCLLRMRAKCCNSCGPLIPSALSLPHAPRRRCLLGEQGGLSSQWITGHDRRFLLRKSRIEWWNRRTNGCHLVSIQ